MFPDPGSCGQVHACAQAGLRPIITVTACLVREDVDERQVCSQITRKMVDFRPLLPNLQLLFFAVEPYMDAARRCPSVARDADLGWFTNFESEFRDPIVARETPPSLLVCPPLFVDRAVSEPEQVQRLYVEGSFLRKLLLFLVPGVGWEAAEQVRAVMRRHFPLQLVTVEVVDGGGPTL